jgi:hypothetical protein
LLKPLAMRWIVCLCLLAGIRLGAMVVGPRPPVPAVITASVGRVGEPALARARAAPPATSPRELRCGDPTKIGTPIAKLETPITTDHAYWLIAAARHACVIVAWTNVELVAQLNAEHVVKHAAELVASFDDGATFAPFGDPGRIRSVAVGDTGTIYVLRADSTLDIYRTDGTTARRALTFGDEGMLTVRGKWLWLAHNVVGDQPAISSDEGATWIHLAWTEGTLRDLAVLDDGTVVGLADYHMDRCDHFGCGDGPLNAAFETTLAGGPWKPATPRHARAVSEQPGTLDSHGLMLTPDNNARYLVRMVGTKLRALYATRPS